MNNRNKYVTVILLLILGIQLCGWGKKNVTVDTSIHHVYKSVDINTFIKDNNADVDYAKEKYNDQYLLISGILKSYDTKKRTLTIVNDLDDDIVCSYDKKTALDLSAFKTNERIAVYGKCEYSFKKYKIENVDKVIKPYSVKSSEQYYTLDGTTLDKTTSIRKSLNNNRIHYYIPNNWKNVEYNIIENDLGNIEGYQYALNQIPESKDSEPESLFVCYFDSNKLKDPNDMKKKENVEKAIIENIEGSVGTFPKEKVKTYYGPTYKYYTGKFTDIYSGSKGYHVEYIFQEVEDRGIVMYVYFYREKRHLSDVMLVTRLLEVD